MKIIGNHASLFNQDIIGYIKLFENIYFVILTNSNFLENSYTAYDNPKQRKITAKNSSEPKFVVVPSLNSQIHHY